MSGSSTLVMRSRMGIFPRDLRRSVARSPPPAYASASRSSTTSSCSIMSWRFFTNISLPLSRCESIGGANSVGRVVGVVCMGPRGICGSGAYQVAPAGDFNEVRRFAQLQNNGTGVDARYDGALMLLAAHPGLPPASSIRIRPWSATGCRSWRRVVSGSLWSNADGSRSRTRCP